MARAATRLVALSLAAGLLMAMAFPLGPPLPPQRWDGWWLPGWICLAPLLMAAAGARRPRDAAACGLLAGLSAFGLILCWMYPFLRRWAGLSAVEAFGVVALLVLYVALYVAAFALCVQRWCAVWGHRVAFLLAPAAWAGLELLRGRLLTGFPWCPLGYSQQPLQPAIQVADLGGVYAVSFLLAAAAGLVADLLVLVARQGAPRRGRAAPWLLLGAVAGGLGYGLVRPATLARQDPDIHVALIQANVAQADKWDPRQWARIEADHVAMTREAARRGASLIVWSETSVPVSLTRHADYASRLESLASETGADILVGTVTYEARRGTSAPFNSVYLVRPGRGLAGRYDKQRLVPFGEYVPLRRLLFFLEPLVKEAGDFQPGDEVRPLAAGRIDLGALICYEAIFPDLTRRWMAAGAEAIVNMTNDAWYGDTAMPRQHLAQSVLRAVESRRYLLRCASTGISALVDPSGRIVRRTRLGQKGILEGRIGRGRGLTLYARTGDAFAIACAILALLALVGAQRGGARPLTTP